MRALIVVAMMFVAGCGGGVSDGDMTAPSELAPWETSKGVCSFDDENAQALAYANGALCRFILVGNTDNWGAWPPSWPSTPVVWRAK